MWRKFKWDMFVTSFIPLWISIVVLDAWNIVSLALKKWDDKNQVLENLQNILCSSYIQLISIAGIAVLVLCSIVGINSFLNKKLTVKSAHPKGTVKKATKANKLSSEFLLAYILPMIAFDFGDPQKLVLFLIYFWYWRTFVLETTIYTQTFCWNSKDIAYTLAILNVWQSIRIIFITTALLSARQI